MIYVESFYREGREKYGVIEQDGFLTYRENITYFYTPGNGELGLDVNVTTVNPVYFVSLKKT